MNNLFNLTRVFGVLLFSFLFATQLSGQCVPNSLLFANGSMSDVDLCLDQGNPTGIKFKAKPFATQYALIFTDEQGIIQDYSFQFLYNFAGSDQGVCLVYGVSFAGVFNTEIIGQNIFDVPLTDLCYEFSQNVITVYKTYSDSLSAGIVSDDQGNDNGTYCTDDGSADLIVLQNSGSTFGNQNYLYVVTNDNNVVIDFADNNIYDAEGLPPGTFRIYGLVYTGDLNLEVGDNIDFIPASDGCHAYSDNFYQLNSISTPSGGVIFFQDGDPGEICAGDGIPDVVTFDVTGNSAVDYAFFITNADNIVVAILPNMNFNFENITQNGACRVYGAAFLGDLTINVGDDITATPISNSCYSLSNNVLVVDCVYLDGGEIKVQGGGTSLYLCLNDTLSDNVIFETSTNSTADYGYVITDENGIVQNFFGQGFDFGNSPSGICLVHGFSYTGTISTIVGFHVDSIPLTTGCWVYASNTVTVTKNDLDGGDLLFDTGDTTSLICVGDTLMDLLVVQSNTTHAGDYLYIITDDNDVVLNSTQSDTLNFTNAPLGVCHIWAAAYTGQVTLQAGDTLSAAMVSDECFTLSRNYLEVNRVEPDGGNVELPFSQTKIVLCLSDTLDDVVTFLNSSSSSAPYAYIITDTFNVMVDITFTDTYDFTLYPEGVCRVWGLSYTGNLTVSTGDTVTSAVLSDDCHDLSSSFVMVIKAIPDAGMVMFTDSTTVANICADAANDDWVYYANNSGSVANYIYAYTDEDDNIIFFTPLDSFNFSNSLPGIIKIYGISFTGFFSGFIGDNVLNDPLATGCWEVSSNFLELNRDRADGGTVFLEDQSSSNTICLSAGGDLVVPVDSSSIGNGIYLFAIADTNNALLGLSFSDSVDFAGVSEDVYRIYGLSYFGNLTIQLGEDVLTAAISDSCYDVSDNFIEITLTSADAGTITSSDSLDAYTFCTGDGNPDIVTFVNSGTSFLPYAYVITDADGNYLTTANGNSFDFDGAPTGDCRVYGLSYNGNLIIQNGENVDSVALSDDCYELTPNFITISRSFVDGGMVTNQFGETEMTVCPGDGSPDFVGLLTSSTATLLYRYVITNTDHEIVEFVNGNLHNFESSTGSDTCYIYGVSASGNFTNQLGLNVLSDSLSDACWEVSTNFVTIIKDSLASFCDSLISPSVITYEGDEWKGDGQFFMYQVFPNPSDTYVSVRYMSSIEAPLTLVIRDLSGRVLLSEGRGIGNGSSELDVSNLSAGMYIMQLQIGEDTYFEKLIVR